MKLLFRALGTKFPHEREVIVLESAEFSRLSGPELREITVNGQTRQVTYYVVDEITA